MTQDNETTRISSFDCDHNPQGSQPDNQSTEERLGNMTTRPNEKECVKMWEQSTSPAEYEDMYDKFMADHAQTTEYVPTHKAVCTILKCKGYEKPLVDRGYGYPVCETVKWIDEKVFNPQPRLPMELQYLEA